MNKNVYGENHPKEEDTKKSKVREQTGGTAEEMDKTRKGMIDQRKLSGGMGRKSTPKQ